MFPGILAELNCLREVLHTGKKVSGAKMNETGAPGTGAKACFTNHNI